LISHSFLPSGLALPAAEQPICTASGERMSFLAETRFTLSNPAAGYAHLFSLLLQRAECNERPINNQDGRDAAVVAAKLSTKRHLAGRLTDTSAA